MVKLKGRKTYTDAWKLTKDVLEHSKATAHGKRLLQAHNYNVTSIKKSNEELLKRKGGKVTVNWK